MQIHMEGITVGTVYSLLCMNLFKIMYKNETKPYPNTTAYKWNRKIETWCPVKAPGHIVFLLTHSCSE